MSSDWYEHCICPPAVFICVRLYASMYLSCLCPCLPLFPPLCLSPSMHQWSRCLWCHGTNHTFSFSSIFHLSIPGSALKSALAVGGMMRTLEVIGLAVEGKIRAGRVKLLACGVGCLVGGYIMECMILKRWYFKLQRFVSCLLKSTVPNCFRK